MKKRLVYLDHASTTPMKQEAVRAMEPHFSEHFGNPSNLYELGRGARQAVDVARQAIAGVLHCRPDEFIFTGSATESDNLALAGIARANREFGNKIIVSSVEHKGIFAVCDALAKEGFEIVRVPVDKAGIIDLGVLKKELDEKTTLVSVTMADSETGTLQPIREIAEMIKKKNLPYFHTDASQAAAHADINAEKLGVDLMTLSAHKLGGPKGIGGLYIRKGTKISPIIFGGGQQGRLRSGTENVPGIVGFAAALTLVAKRRKAESVRLKKLRDMLEKGIRKSIPKVLVNGHPKNRLPNILNVSILDIEGEALLLHLDSEGIMVNTGSACNSESLEPSAVLTAQGNPYEFVHGSIRFSLGEATTESDIKYVLNKLPGIVEMLRQISPLDLSLDQKQPISDPRAFIGNQTPHFVVKSKKHVTKN